MMNWLSICLTGLFVIIGKFNVVVSTGIDTNAPINIAGIWYAVMSTEVSDKGPCNIMTNNKLPCKCLSIEARELGRNGWQITSSSLNSNTDELTLDVGGISAKTTENKELNGFVSSRATIKTTAVITKGVDINGAAYGYPQFMKYGLSIIGWNVESFYMITKLSIPNGPDPFYIIFCRKKHPNKKNIWTNIVQNLKKLNINSHTLSFINQDKCTYSLASQYDEMFFC